MEAVGDGIVGAGWAAVGWDTAVAVGAGAQALETRVPHTSTMITIRKVLFTILLFF
jgi:hypothetical protein